MRSGQKALHAGLLACGILAILAFAGVRQASAQIGSERYAAIVLDARTGAVLTAANPDETRHPASLTKMMTLYMVFDALREGRVRLDSRVPISEEAASRPPSKLGVPAGMSISVEQAILALVTRSANDVATAVGERLGGSEYRFAQMMTLRARSLGMSRTLFRNASGLPDPDQVTTARDMATLGRRLIQDFPDRYQYFGVSHAEFGNVRIRNHNRMLMTYEGVDGIKTGYINASGFNIVTSARRGGQRVVGAVFGGSSWVERDAHMASLLDQSFAQLGVAPRDVAGGPGVLRTAQAAPLPRGPAAATARTTTTSRQTATRQTATSRQASTRQAASRQTATRQANTRQATTRQAASRGTGTTRTATVRARGTQPPTASAAQSAAPGRSSSRSR
ncbi:D-alanyl-D-alanine carboxypeptidase family protein [Roseomonas sp. AR75]|uniref:D-alanyl-D-alanine carboxypeptidase family protein n=1 Tax=Roseomonas sp. AR75 TaxID=2562311 RepID=UPI00197D0DCC|nr:D-alanyl-D-alanine carboxypeptidase family protein [Roseomonas sp. AR75]